MLPSTNEFALDLLSKSSPNEGTVISTYYQTRGRGQFGKNWQSEANKNLTVSVILHPDFLEARQQFFLSQVFSLAVRDTIASFLPEKQVSIKWPNDILVSGKKIAGILIQNSLQNKRIQSCVGGVGININQKQFDNVAHAASLSMFTGKKENIQDVLKVFLIKLEQWYILLKKGKETKVKNTYMEHLFGLNESLVFNIPGEPSQSGIIRDVEPSGKLIVEIDGVRRAFDLKEISFLYESKNN